MAGSLTTASPVDRVRISCRRVAEAARHVRMDSARLQTLADRLADDQFELPVLDIDSHYVDDVESGGADTAAFFLTLEAVNFGSGSFGDLRHTSKLSGYFTIAGALARHWRTRGALSAAELASIDMAACALLFGQAGHSPAASLMARFTHALNELGHHVEDLWDGSFTALIGSARESAESLVEHLLQIDGFRDEAHHRGQPVYFYKRAQLTAADLSLAFGNLGWGHFRDLDRLTVFADDLVPHVLRTEGVLEYSLELARRVDRGESLPAGSEEEVEIRACSIDAAERLVALLHERGTSLDARRLDYRLWNLGLGSRYRQRPPHRTVSRFY